MFLLPIVIDFANFVPTDRKSWDKLFISFVLETWRMMSGGMWGCLSGRFMKMLLDFVEKWDLSNINLLL